MAGEADCEDIMRLVAENLAGERGGEFVFADLSFALEAAEALVVTGPNGSGKSTMLRILAGLLPAAGGTAKLEGGGEEWPTIASACHYLGHANAMKTGLTVAENLGFWRDFLGHPHLSIDEALDMVGLPDIGHLPFGYLSTGQKRRVAIAKMLTSYRPVWLVDEPTAGLDKASEKGFEELMQLHLEDGGIIVAATHLPLEITDPKRLEMSAARPEISSSFAEYG
jgi:heme exporter protein A